MSEVGANARSRFYRTKKEGGELGETLVVHKVSMLRGLHARSDLARLLRSAAVIESMLDLLWEHCVSLQGAAAATDSEVQSKVTRSPALACAPLAWDVGVCANERESACVRVGAWACGLVCERVCERV